MNNLQRAAIVLLGMGKEQASQVLRHMDPKEVEKLAVAMKSIANINDNQINEALGKFLEISNVKSGIGLATNEYIRETLIDALGDEKAKSLLDKTLLVETSKGLDALNWQDPSHLIEFVVEEHPQVIAIVVTYLESEQAAALLSMLDEKVRIDVIKRVASLGSISPLALQLLNEAMEEQLQEMNHFKELPLGGAKTAASIINFLDSDTESKVIKELGSTNKDLSLQVQDMMFPFENFNRLDDRGLQRLLREIPGEVLMDALKAAEDEFKERCFKNMSANAAAILKDDMEVAGPVKLSVALAAQKKMINIAQKLAKQGELVIGVSGEKMVS